ncbi:MAG: ATP-grasp domain-containing protein [Clostridiales bacterium]|nr:ATP-grasp domain-containing protein [Clostridiales bacterium]
MVKVAIIGASYLQLPLIKKAREKGLETHVFAWECGDVGEREADFFYPISTVEKEAILDECIRIGIDGICSISSDVAVKTVNYVAEKMGLPGNSIISSELSTNKGRMKETFKEHGIPSSVFVVTDGDISDGIIRSIPLPLIVKPTDRSGSRAITRIDSYDDDIKSAVERAVSQSFEKKAIVEHFVCGREYSVECISFQGSHRLLSVTKKYTTGSPHYIERAHLEPSDVSPQKEEEIRRIIFRALDALEVKNGASHSEIKIDSDGNINVIEIGSRMGGDMIGSHLVLLSTGFDFVEAVLDVALGNAPKDYELLRRHAAIRFITEDEDLKVYERIRNEEPGILAEYDTDSGDDGPVIDSSSRKGYYIIVSEDREKIVKYLPDEDDIH